MSIECFFCREQSENVESAIDSGWFPSFYDGETETAVPVCPVCVKNHLYRDNDGEYCRNTIGTELVRLSPQARTAIRNAFYGISDHIQTLADALEMADLERGGKGGPLIEQHLIVCEMLAAYDKLSIGRFV